MNIVYPYAKAIYELLENNLSELENIKLALDELAQIANQENLLKQFLLEPFAKSEDKINLIGKLAPKLMQNEITSKLILLLASKKKLPYILQIGAALEAIMDEKNHISQIEIISAHALTEQELSDIKNSLEKSLKQTISLKTSTDPNLIAGLIIKTDDYILDNSLKGRLHKMQQNLLTV